MINDTIDWRLTIRSIDDVIDWRCDRLMNSDTIDWWLTMWSIDDVIDWRCDRLMMRWWQWSIDNNDDDSDRCDRWDDGTIDDDDAIDETLHTRLDFILNMLRSRNLQKIIGGEAALLCPSSLWRNGHPWRGYSVNGIKLYWILFFVRFVATVTAICDMHRIYEIW